MTEILSIIMPCKDNLFYTRICIETLTKNTLIPYELIIIDNASKAPTKKYLNNLKLTRKARVITNKRNLGAPAAFNQGIRAASGDIMILLNNDTLLTEGWAERLMRALKSYPKAAAAAPLLNPPDAPEISIREVIRTAAYIQLRNRGTVTEVPGVTSTCLALKKEVLDILGGFDENYGLGTNDDHDLCLRIRKEGYKIILVEDVFVYHYWGRTLSKMGMDELDRRNRKYFISKFGSEALSHLKEVGQSAGLNE